MHQDLMVPFPQINFAEDFTASDSLRKIQHIRKRVRIQYRHQVQPPVVAARPPAAI
jgi:hypothetical protein